MLRRPYPKSDPIVVAFLMKGVSSFEQLVFKHPWDSFLVFVSMGSIFGNSMLFVLACLLRGVNKQQKCDLLAVGPNFKHGQASWGIGA